MIKRIKNWLHAEDIKLNAAERSAMQDYKAGRASVRSLNERARTRVHAIVRRRAWTVVAIAIVAAGAAVALRLCGAL